MRIEYRKLVRDRIPEIVRRDGSLCEAETMAEEAYHQALREKLVEEACEAAGADAGHLMTELADVYEVIDALLASSHIAYEAVRAEQERRRAERGGFGQRVCLLWTSEGPIDEPA